MGAKGSQTSQQTQTYNPAGASYLQSALNQAQGLAGQSFTVPTAPVAGFSPQQQQAFNLAGSNVGVQNPYLAQAASYYNAGTTPNVSQFFNPYASAVTAQMQNIFGQQQQQNNANLVQSAGGVGADRIAVGQGNLANQQDLAAGQTLASLYAPALSAATQQEGLLQNAGAGTAALGNQAQTAGINDVNSLLTTGGLQQQLQQAQLNAPYQQQLSQLALPYQLSNFNTAATGALAPALGGQTTGQSQTQYDPSLMSQILGGGALGTALIGGTGGFGANGWLTGALGKGARAGGAVPYADGGGVGGSIPTGGFSLLGNGIIPQSQIHAAAAPRPQLNFSSPNMQQMGQQGMQGLLSLGKEAGQLSGSLSGPAWGGGSMFGGDAFGGNAANPLPGLDAGDYGSARGGAIRNPYYADAGEVSDGTDALRAAMIDAGYAPSPGDGGGMEDRFQPTKDAIASGAFDPQGINETTFQGTPGMVASNQGSVPLPASRPGDAGPSAAQGAGDDDNVDETPPASTPTAGNAPSNPYAAGASGDGTSGFGNFLKSPWMALAMAGLGAFTPAGFAGGAAQGLKLMQGQESIDQAARKLDEEVRQHQFEETQLNAYQKEQIAVAKAKIKADQSDDVIDDDTARFYGKIYSQTGQMPSLGYGRNAAMNRAKIAKFAMEDANANNQTPGDVIANRAGYAADKAAAATAARQGAGIDRAVIEAQNTFPLAEQASAAVPRGQWTPINKLSQAIKSGTSDPAMAQFYVANQGAINAYAAAMGRGNPVTTVHAQQHAEELLSTAQSHQAYVAALHQMQKEMVAARAAPGAVRQDIQGRISGRQAGTGAASAAPAATGPAKAPVVWQNGHRYELQPDGSYQ